MAHDTFASRALIAPPLAPTEVESRKANELSVSFGAKRIQWDNVPEASQSTGFKLATELAYDVELAGGRGLAYRVRKGSFYGVNGRQCCLAILQGWASAWAII